MALNHRTREIIPSENVPPSNVIHGKAFNGKTVTTGITRRAAFNDINNKINQEVTKKPLGLIKPSVVKTTKTTTISNTHVVQRDTKKTVVTKTATSKTEAQKKVTCGVKREESIVKPSSVVTKSEPEVAAFKEPKAPKSYSTQCIDVIDEGEDPQFVAEYINDIFAYLRSLESKFSIDERFLSCHRTTSRMRSVLVNWLVEVHSNFRLLPESLHLCVSIVDRYLQKNKTVGRDNLQLVGITALFIAAKYEEMYIPDMFDFVYVCDETFKQEEILRMEMCIIKALDYSFGRPLSLHFLRRFSKIAKVQPQHHSLGKYLLELALIELDLCHVRPSLQAAASCCLALSVLNENKTTPAKIWSRTMIHYSTYTFADLEKPMKLLAQAVVKAETSKYQAIRNKYSSSSNGKVSLSSELKGPVIQKYAQK